MKKFHTAFIIRIFILLLCSVHTNILFSQNNDSNSEEEIKKSEQSLRHLPDNKQKILTLFKIIEYYRTRNPGHALNSAAQAVRICREKFPGFLAKAYLQTAGVFYFQNEPDSVIKYARLALQSPGATEKDKGDAYNLLSVSYRNKGDLDKALASGYKSVEIFMHEKDSVQAYRILDNMSGIYSARGNYKKALELALKSLQVFEKHKLTKDMVISYYKIANLYADMHKYDLAKKYYLYSLNHSDSIHNPYLHANIYNNLGTVYEETNRLETAEYYYQRALNFFRSINLQDGIATVRQNLGIIYRKKGLYDMSSQYL
jgi:tetratricopeptide (TPR) repeat protein